MNNRGNLNSSILTIIIACATAILCGCATNRWDIDNPYSNVDWDQYQKVKANFHTHTTQSDGRMSPSEVIDEYHKLGYGVLALTDHNMVTWPWNDYDRDAESLEMVAVQGAEPSRHHHMGAYFCDVPGTTSEAETLALVRAQNGIAVMFHPGRYEWSREDYVALYTEWDELVGMEIFNQGDRYAGDRKIWDSVLTVLMAERRPVWGFSNDDMHRDTHLGRNWNVLLLPELSPEAARTAMEEGIFLFVYAPEGQHGTAPPDVDFIEVNSRKGIIRIGATNFEKIEWISGGVVVHHGETIDLAATTNVQDYIRAVIHAKNGAALIGTQPIRVQPRSR